MLKSRCREFGIQRWPYRKVKKLDNLIGALAKDGGAGAELLVELKDCREYLLANPSIKWVWFDFWTIALGFDFKVA